MNTILPDCMMPDGADPCAGYKQLVKQNDKLRAEVAALPVGCVGVGDSKCNYLATCGRLCNKCGKVHDGQRTPFVRNNDEIERLRELLQEALDAWTGDGPPIELDRIRAALGGEKS